MFHSLVITYDILLRYTKFTEILTLVDLKTREKIIVANLSVYNASRYNDFILVGLLSPYFKP